MPIYISYRKLKCPYCGKPNILHNALNVDYPIGQKDIEHSMITFRCEKCGYFEHLCR